MVKTSLQLIKDGLVLVLLFYAVAWNIQTLPTHSPLIKGAWLHLAEATRIDQKFDMFSPFPLLDDGWYVIPGKLADGREVDLFREGAQVSYEKPKDVQALYANQRWQKYMMNLWSADNSKYRLSYGRYLCRSWNSNHGGDDTLKTFAIIFMKEKTLPDFKTEKINPTTLWEHHCF